MPIAGYYHVRLAEKVLDPLEANALALSLGEKRLLILALDVIGLPARYMDPLREHLAEAAGLPLSAVFVACTHTHTGPLLRGDVRPETEAAYFETLKEMAADAVRRAFLDLKPARMGWAVGRAPRIAFIRRFLMKDGSVRTNPGVGNPDIVGPVGQPDERVSVLRFDREGGEAVALVHFAVHPDTVGGCVISADWPGFARRTLEKALDGVRCLVLNGAQGDVNHVNTAPLPGELNDLTVDFDNVMRGYGHARHMGAAVAGAVLQVFAKVRYTPVYHLLSVQSVARHPANLPDPKELPQARLYNRLHQEGRDSEIPCQGMELTVAVAEAERILQLEHGPQDFALPMAAVAIGDAALVSVPGEPFSAVGRVIRAAPGWPLVLPCCCANGYEGYFPDMDAYRNGSYEVRSSVFRAGVGETVSGEALRLLRELQNAIHREEKENGYADDP